MHGGNRLAATMLRSALRRVFGAAIVLMTLAGTVGIAGAADQSGSQVSAINSSPSEPNAAVSISPPPGYRLGPGDHVRITIFGQKDLTGVYAVDGSGMLAFPLIGSVKAGGLTITQLQSEIGGKLSPDYIKNPSVAVEVLTPRPFYIVGEVQKPGSYPYVSGMSVINAVALAGGFTYRARENDFYLDRHEQDGKTMRLDATPETTVEPGDVITVRERFW
jgi:protein involved in polysaccharide export with SLBB domain